MINDTSKLKFAQSVAENGVTFWVMPKLPTIPVTTSDSYYMVKSGDRLDSISNQFYGTPMYAWFIALASGVYLEENVSVGNVLRIPAFLTLIQYMTGLSS
jgi:nucleoid-associated protein YgaU